jgi:phosphoribosylglycinamide formyltransferase-1
VIGQECPRLPVVVLISGTGSNLRAIAERAREGAIPVEIRAVISDRPEATGLAWAAASGIETAVVPAREFADREAFDAALADRVDRYSPQLVALAGFMRVLGADFVARYLGRMLNIHPSLLPRHRGLATHRRALAAGDRVHGASVHFVTAELDGGPVILQARVPVHEGDDEASLAARVLAQEHRIYPECIGWFAEGRLTFRDGAAVLDGKVLAAPVVREARDELAA